jgi:hypothetical protein
VDGCGFCGSPAFCDGFVSPQPGAVVLPSSAVNELAVVGAEPRMSTTSVEHAGSSST